MASVEAFAVESEGTKDVPTSFAVSFVSRMSIKVDSILKAPAPSASFGSTVFNLLKNMLGSSFLSMGDALKIGSIVPGLFTFGLVGCIGAATMTLVASLCHKYKAKSYRELWSKVVGPITAPLVDMAILLNAAFSCISYCLLIGSWMTQGLKELFGGAFGNQTVNTIVIAMFILFPLTLLRDLHALRHTSMAGVACNIFGVCFIVWQASLHAPERIPNRTCGSTNLSGCTAGEVLSANLFKPSLKLVSTFNMCASMFMAHYNVPKFYSEYHQQDPVAFGKAVTTGVVLAIMLASTMAFAGVLRFGADMADGNILKHFNDQFPGKPNGIMSEAERVATLITWCIMSLNIMASFPLLMSPLRISLLQLFGTSVSDLSSTLYVGVTASILAFCVVCGLNVENLSIVTKFKGAICGMSIAYIFPALLLWKSSKGSRSNGIIIAVSSILFVGVSLMCYGLKVAIGGLLK